MKNLIFLLLILLHLGLFAQDHQLSKQIDSLIQSETSPAFNGIILITKKGKPVYEKVMGYGDFEKETPLSLESEFVIGSISKQFTAVLVLREYDQGRIDLHVPIRTYLPELTQTWADTITVHQLLTHTHGIISLDEPTTFPPGTAYAYSQIGYDLLAMIIEKTSGESFAVMSSMLFDQCKMYHTFHPDNWKYNHLVNGYTENESGDLVLEKNSFHNYPAAGSFISTASDLVQWNKMFYGGKLLKKKTMQLLTTKHPVALRNHPLFGITEYGYGITVDTKEDILQYGQTGFAPGFVSMNFYFPKTKTSLIILSNTAYHTTDFIQTFKFHMAIWHLVRSSF